MRTKIKSGLVLATAIASALVCYAEVRAAGVLWLDFDMKNIPEPKARSSSYYDYFFKGQLIEETKRDLDIPRLIRGAVGHRKQAANVNALDEVPDSSWYTNRHYLHAMTTAELKRGPNSLSTPDLTNAIVTRAKESGVEPGLQLKDTKGNSYLIKFDGIDYPNLQSAAEVVSTKILYAVGYNVPENYIAIMDPMSLRIGENAQIKDAKTGQPRPLTRGDIDEMLRHVARMPDGRCRVVASRILPGKAKGPFPQIGLRLDDPNDLIPHEHRRELRGLRVIASWINHWDMKEPQALDMYVEEGGRKFLRHYLLDFGSTLGADDMPEEYFHGREYGLDFKNIGKEIVTLGLHESPDEKRDRIINPEVGHLSNDDFDPGKWKPTYPTIMFDNMTDNDAFWATRIILSFTEPQLRSMVETGQYSDPRDVDYIVRTLLERRQIIARYWLSKVNGLSNFAVRRAADGIILNFHDLMVDNKLASRSSTAYTYQVNGLRFKTEKKNTTDSEIRIDRATLSAAIERGGTDATIEVTIWTSRDGSTLNPVKVYFDWSPSRDAFTIRRIARG